MLPEVKGEGPGALVLRAKLLEAASGLAADPQLATLHQLLANAVPAVLEGLLGLACRSHEGRPGTRPDHSHEFFLGALKVPMLGMAAQDAIQLERLATRPDKPLKAAMAAVYELFLSTPDHPMRVGAPRRSARLSPPADVVSPSAMERRNRQSWLGSVNIAPKGSSRRQEQERGMQRALADPRVGSILRAKLEEVKALFEAQQASGAALTADEVLRYFQRDYQNRLMRFGGRGMPTSYRTAEAFFQERPGLKGFFLLPELDFIISFADFLAFVTEPTGPSAVLDSNLNLREGVIYNVTSNDVIEDLLLQTKGESAYAFRAASLVRRHDELTVMVSLGEQMPAEKLARWTEERARAELNQHLNPARPDVLTELPDPDLACEPVLVPGTSLLETTAIIRFNLRSGRQEARCLLRDMGILFDTLTDEVESLAGAFDAENEGFQRMVGELDDCDAIWEVAKTLTLLPAYLAARVDGISTQDKRTELGARAQASLKERRKLDPLKPADRVLFKTISAVKPVSRAASETVHGRTYTAPRYQVPVDGFWRTLANAKEGRDHDGNPVVGKTWVRSHIRFKDRDAPDEPKVVYIKASLSDAKRRMEAYRRAASRSGLTPAYPVDLVLPSAESPSTSLPAAVEEVKDVEEVEDGSHGAFVYVMRCEAHVEHLYKVGFTDRDPDVRARELSASTSAPVRFIVVHAWPVTDGVAAERAAHAALQGVRLASNREFFQVPFWELRAQLDQVVKPWVIA